MIIQVIHLTEHEVTCARFERTGRDQLAPLTGFRLPYAHADELVSLLRDQLPIAEDAKREVRTILALPPTLVTMREMSLPFTERSKIRAVLPHELARESALGDLELVCDGLPLAGGTVLACWSPLKSVATYITLLDEAGYEPEVVTVACMHWNLLIPSYHQGPVAMVDPHAVLVAQNNPQSIIFCRSLGRERSDLTRTLTAVELDKEITIATIFSLETELPFDLPSTSTVVPLPLPELLSVPAVGGTMPASALAAPLTTAQAYCAGTIFNLRSGQLAWTRRTHHWLRRYRTTLILAAIALSLVFAESGIRWFLLTRDLTSLNNSISKIYRQIFPTRKKAVDEVSEIRAEIRRLQGGIATQSMLSFLTILADAKGALINGLSEVDYDGSQFRIKGDSRNSNDLSAFRQRLVAAGLTVDQPELTSRPDGTVLFTLKGRQGGSAP